MRPDPVTASLRDKIIDLPSGPGGPSASDSLPSVEERVAESTEVWARDLRAVFEHARERFGDVTWESEDGGARIWGHKAMIYARAPKAFKDRYFISRPFSRSPTSMRSPSPHLPPLFPSRPSSPPSSFRRPSPRLGASSSLSVNTITSQGTVRLGEDGVLRLAHGDTPEMFQAQLEWLYTGEGFGDVVEWISAEDTGEEIGSGAGVNIRDSLGRRGNQADRRDKLGQDLTYMWRSKLYADVRIHLDAPASMESASDDSDDSTDSLSSTAIFTAHRFMLASRSPYFASVLLNPSSFRPSTADIHLPTPPLTPAALHFCLGYIYAGHLDFSNRTFDLLTAFQIHRAAAYLQLESLKREVEARIVHDFCHGLEWEKCHCRRCPLRAARVWRFASSPDVGAVELAHKARKWVVRAWGDCWGKEIGTMDQADKDALVRDVIAGITPRSVVSAIRSAAAVRARMENALRTKGREAAVWVDGLEGMLEQVEAQVRLLLVEEFQKIAEGKELWDLVSGKGFSADLLETVCQELVDGVGTARGCVEGPRIYQALVSSILLKVDPDTLQTALPARSRGRQEIEVAKDGVLAHIRRRWMQIRDAGGFHGLENWSLKEISDEIEIPVDDLVSLSLSPPKSVGKHTSAVISRTSIPRPTSHVISLGETSSLRDSPIPSPRPPTVARSSAARDATTTPTTEASGLRRLRLSSSASTSSVASSRSASQRPTATTNSPLSGPQARSPTAARKGTTVPVGSARARTNATNAANGAEKRAVSPSPSSKTAQRPPMSGPPRPLLTRATAGKVTPKAGPSTSGSRATSPGPSVNSVRTTRSTRSTATTMSTALKATEAKAGPSKAPSIASVRSTRTSVTSAASKPAAVKPTSTQSEAPSNRVRNVSTATTSSVRSRAAAMNKAATASAVPPVPRLPNGVKGTDKLEPPVTRVRTTSGGTMTSVTSVRSKAPSIASVASTAKSTVTTRTPTTPRASAARLHSTLVKPGTSAKSNDETKASGPSLLTKKAAPSGPSGKAPTPGSSIASKPPSITPSTASRTRNMSTTSTLSKSSQRLRPPPSSMPSLLPPLRSPSASTDEAPETRTPRLSETFVDPIIRRDGSSGSDLASPPPPSAKLPPVIIPRDIRKTSSGSTRSTASALRMHPANAFDPPPRATTPKSPVKLEITDGSKPFDGAGISLHVGIPCIVSLEKKRARFRASVKYIGQMRGSRGPWVGIETEDLERFGVPTLASGAKEGVHYFHLTPTALDEGVNMDAKASRLRQIDRIREGLGKPSRLLGLGLGLANGGHGLGLGLPIPTGLGGERGGTKRSASPFVGDWTPVERPRALFVRPSEVVFIMGAE